MFPFYTVALVFDRVDVVKAFYKYLRTQRQYCKVGGYRVVCCNPFTAVGYAVAVVARALVGTFVTCCVGCNLVFLAYRIK